MHTHTRAHMPCKNWAPQSAKGASAIYIRRTISIYCIVINLHNRIITILLKQTYDTAAVCYCNFFIVCFVSVWNVAV